MSGFEGMVPFILRWEVRGFKGEWERLPQGEMFARARAVGYGYDPADSGGHTVCGVTLATYAAYRKKRGAAKTTVEDLKAISYGEWRDILKGMFWDRWMADGIDSFGLAAALVDWTWHSGKHGITIPQQLLGVKADGIVGPKTLAALNGVKDRKAFFGKVQAARKEFLLSRSKPGTRNAKFRSGWLNRVEDVTKRFGASI